MRNWFYKRLLTGAARKVLVGITIWLVAKGYVSQSDQPELVKIIEQYLPAITAFVWDYVEKKIDAQHRQVAIDASGMTPARLALESQGVALRKS